MSKASTSTRKLTSSVIIIIVLSICLCITTFALVYSTVAVENNLFQTGTVKVNLNDGKAVISENEFIFEPGMRVKKDFFIENMSSCDVYYKLYFQNIEGGLSDVLNVEIKDGENLLWSGTPDELTNENVGAADDVLKLRERRDLQIYFHFPENADNSTQELYLTFDLAADVVQTKNNSDKNFG